MDLARDRRLSGSRKTAGVSYFQLFPRWRRLVFLAAGGRSLGRGRVVERPYVQRGGPPERAVPTAIVIGRLDTISLRTCE